MRKAHWLLFAVAAIAAVLFPHPAAQAATRGDAAKRLEDFRRFFVDFQMAPDRAAPADLLAQCHGVIIMRQYKAGFVFGVKGGDGVIFLRDAAGGWSPPAFIQTAEGSFGFQIGGQAIDAIILIMNQDGVNMLLKSRFQIGVDASAAAGPVGRDASAKVGPGTALLAYSRAKGLYAGVAFEGGAFLNNNKYNRALYGRDIGVRDILFSGMASVPPEAVPMINELRSYAGFATQPPAETVIVQEPAYSQTPVYAQEPSYTYVEPEIIYPSTMPMQPPPPPEPGPSLYSTPQPAGPSPEQSALEQAAADAARAAQEASEAAVRAQRAAQEAAERAAAARSGAAY